MIIGENEFLSKHIDAYKLISELSSGQLSIAYKAIQVNQSARTVVVHLFHAVHLPDAKHEQFLREVRTLKKVKHAHILPIVESGFYDDIPYIVTEYAARGSLRDRINQSPQLTTQETVTILSNIGQALQFNHQVNIIHGNLKPENILFDEQGKARLVDCRIMTIADSIPIEMAHNTNTFPYMAPEQFYGKTSKESDQYALGCIAYELLTGIAPFAQADFRTMGNRHEQEALVPPTQLNMLLPNHLQEAVLTAMAKQERDRFPHIKDFVAALTAPARPPVIAIVSPSPVIPIVSSASSASGTPGTFSVSGVNDVPLSFTEVASQQSIAAQTDTTTKKPEKPPDTPAISLPVEEPAHVESIPVSTSPSIPDSIETKVETGADAPPATPQPAADKEDITRQVAQPEQENQVTHHSAPFDTSDKQEAPARHKLLPVDDDIPTIPVPTMPMSSAQPANNPPQARNLPEFARNLLASAPVQTTIAEINKVFAGSDNERRKLAKNFALLVGISWLIIAVLILSMLFIILPSVHVPAGKSTSIVHTPTQQPTKHPSPTAHPRATPTLHPTPSPTPKPTPSPTPSPSPAPSPTPSPFPVPGLVVSPTSINPTTDCQSIPLGYRCAFTLSLPQTHEGNVRWTTSSSNLFVFFSPPRGTLSPGQQQQVTVYVRNQCPHSGDLIFQTDSTRLVIPLNC